MDGSKQMVKVVRVPAGIDIASLEPPQEDWIVHALASEGIAKVEVRNPKPVKEEKQLSAEEPQAPVPPLRIYVPRPVQVGTPIASTHPNKKDQTNA